MLKWFNITHFIVYLHFKLWFFLFIKFWWMNFIIFNFLFIFISPYLWISLQFLFMCLNCQYILLFVNFLSLHLMIFTWCISVNNLDSIDFLWENQLVTDLCFISLFISFCCNLNIVFFYFYFYGSIIYGKL